MADAPDLESQLQDIVRRAREEFAMLAPNEKIHRLVRRHNDLQGHAAESDGRAAYYSGQNDPNDFDEEGWEGNRREAAEARAEIGRIKAELAELGVTDIAAETHDLIHLTGRHRLH